MCGIIDEVATETKFSSLEPFSSCLFIYFTMVILQSTFRSQFLRANAIGTRLSGK